MKKIRSAPAAIVKRRLSPDTQTPLFVRQSVKISIMFIKAVERKTKTIDRLIWICPFSASRMSLSPCKQKAHESRAVKGAKRSFYPLRRGSHVLSLFAINFRGAEKTAF